MTSSRDGAELAKCVEEWRVRFVPKSELSREAIEALTG